MKRVGMYFLAGVMLAFGAARPDAPAQEPENDVVRLGPGITVPKLTYKVEPAYSRAGEDAGVQGVVLIEIVIDKAGLPQDITVLSPLGFGMDERAVQSVSQWRFQPATREGKPVKVRAQVEVHFRMLGRNFDSKAEERRTRFNAIVSRLSRAKDGKPSEQDVKTIQDLSKHKLPGADYLIGIWELKGEVLPKDLEGGLANIQRAADKNYGPALYFMGQAQRQGYLMPKDPLKGLSLIRDAAVLGSKEAQLVLGEMYEKGDGVETDIGRAKRYFRLCAASGTPECQFQLGKLLLDSPQRRESDWLQAIAWFELAENHKLAEAREMARSEEAKLTPEQTKWVARLRDQLERRP